jgi:Domain of unknown function (DUF4333)
VLAVVALATAGCGTSKLDTSRLEKDIKTGIADRTGLGIRSASCPDEVDAKKGATFSCAVVTEKGERATVEVTQEDAKGSVRWRLVRRGGGR